MSSAERAICTGRGSQAMGVMLHRHMFGQVLQGQNWMPCGCHTSHSLHSLASGSSWPQSSTAQCGWATTVTKLCAALPLTTPGCFAQTALCSASQVIRNAEAASTAELVESCLRRVSRSAFAAISTCVNRLDVSTFATLCRRHPHLEILITVSAACSIRLPASSSCARDLKSSLDCILSRVASCSLLAQHMHKGGSTF